MEIIERQQQQEKAEQLKEWTSPEDVEADRADKVPIAAMAMKIARALIFMPPCSANMTKHS